MYIIVTNMHDIESNALENFKQTKRKVTICVQLMCTLRFNTVLLKLFVSSNCSITKKKPPFLD